MNLQNVAVRWSEQVRKAFAVVMIALCAMLWSVPPVQADPPPWAPAHGHRAKNKHKKKHDHDVVYVAPFDIDLGRCNRELLGSVLGGVAGGAIGSTIGSGDGRTVAIVGGTIIGVIVGGSIGRAMDQVDQNCVGQILEHAPDGRTVAWNEQGGPAYQVTPVKTFQTQSGTYCRDYTTSAVIAGERQQLYGTACRQPDGSWQLVN
ncbi:RT0821/Lpp0805 family surface protein [Virgifigura deserti]|uniref:RT0821/Lpp0805 family surface protein n=1 Tax=Virgifigura deserti TaxID=2268457 RepID=UPI003CCB8764